VNEVEGKSETGGGQAPPLGEKLSEGSTGLKSYSKSQRLYPLAGNANGKFLTMT